jgi:hypothetical protein
MLALQSACPMDQPPLGLRLQRRENGQRMKTISQVAEWCAGAAEQFGDPATPVCQLFARYVPNLSPVFRPGGLSNDDLLCTMQGELTLLLSDKLGIALPMSQAATPLISASGDLTAFGAEPIAPGVWSLTPFVEYAGPDPRVPRAL